MSPATVRRSRSFRGKSQADKSALGRAGQGAALRAANQSLAELKRVVGIAPTAPAAEALVKEIIRLAGWTTSPRKDEQMAEAVLAAKNYLGQYATVEFTLTALQASALRNAGARLMEGDLEGAEGQLNHVALYPILHREDDLSAFIQTLHAYVQKLIEVFRC